jgi:hypothetical protein
MVRSLTFYRRGEICDAIAAQATTNALSAGLVLVDGELVTLDLIGPRPNSERMSNSSDRREPR